MSAPVLAVFLWAIAQVETGGVAPARPGPAGETGRWQITPAVRAAHAKGLSDREVAERHVRWLERNLGQGGTEPTIRNLALAWNAGLTATIYGKAPRRAHDYAQRVENLCNERLNP